MAQLAELEEVGHDRMLPADQNTRAQVVVEVYASHSLDIKAHVLLSLVLYKMVDPQPVSIDAREYNIMQQQRTVLAVCCQMAPALIHRSWK